jgi:hypothetical protein
VVGDEAGEDVVARRISATYAIRSVFCFAYFSAFCVLRIFDPNYVLRIAYCV